MRILVAIAAVVACAACGCGKRTTTVTGPDGTTVTVDQSGGKVEIKGRGADGSVSAFSTGGVKVPDDFPKDVPLYPGATPVFHTSVQNNRTLLLTTADATDKVTAFYRDKLKAEGWKLEGEFAMGEIATLNGKKASRELVVAVARQDDGTNVNLSVTAEEKSKASDAGDGDGE